MPPLEVSGLTPDTTPDPTDITNVQDAAGTVDKKVALADFPIPTAVQTALDAHTGDSSGAHAASAISILDTADDFTATNVEAALAELQADHEADAQALSDLDDEFAAHVPLTTNFHGVTSAVALPEVWVSNGAGGYILASTIQRIYVGPDDPASASPGGRSQNYDVWIDTSA
jgi:hypothetical protein